MNSTFVVLMFIFLGVPYMNVHGKRGGIIGPRAELADPHEFPFFALIIKFGAYFACGGSLIKRNVVLTAAHCVLYDGKPMKPDLLSVDLGIVSRSKDEEGTVQRMLVTRVVAHPFYNYNTWRTHVNDVALLFLCDKPTLNAFVQLMPNLAKKKDNLPIKQGGNCVVIGFGASNFTEDGWGIYPDLLHKAYIDIRNAQECKQILEGLGSGTKVIPKKEVCTFEEDGTRACFGDSGGPLFCDPYNDGSWIQYGLVSYGPSWQCEVGMSVYARISYYRQWILRQVRRYG